MSDIHQAANALVDYATDTFWRTDSGFARQSRHDYKAAAAWLHEYAANVTSDTATHLFWPESDETELTMCGEGGPMTTVADRVTCGWCRVQRHLHDAEMAAARDADRVARVRVEGEAS